jgi:hypothetical protein
MALKALSTPYHDPCCAATKNLCNTMVASGPSIETSLVRNKYKVEQASVNSFFHHNPTPTRVVIIDEDNNPTKQEAQIPIHSTSAYTDVTGGDFVHTTTGIAPPPSNPRTPGGQRLRPTQWQAPPEFFTQLIETMKLFSAPQQPQKVVVKSQDHKESANLAKLQTSMLKLMYVSGNIDWDKGTVKNIQLATFLNGFRNLIDRTAMVQVTQLSNLFLTVFTTKPEDDNDDTPINPLNWLMSLPVFPQEFTKAHLNASFQSIDLEIGMIYKSISINPVHYAPQTNRALVKVAYSKMEEGQNKFNWRIIEKYRKQVSLIIEEVGHVTSLDDVAMTCTNICGVQLAIVDFAASKSILYQLAWKIINFIENKRKPKPGCMIIRMQLRIFQ